MPTIKFIGTIILSLLIIFLVLMIRYKPAYAVTFNNEVIGYVDNKDNFNEIVNNEILTSDNESVAFVSLDNVSYSFEYVTRSEINEDKVIDTLKENSKNIYRVYEVSNGDDSESVFYNTIEEAQSFVDSLKSDYSDLTENLTITPLYLETEITSETIAMAKEKVVNALAAEKQEIENQKKIESQTVNGVYLACKPVDTGTISSRFGANESVRNHTHLGIDIAASYGTPIKAAADGTVKTACFNDGGYGYLVVIDHGNGIETYYGHCSKLLVTAGQTVSAGDVIAKVGSTGHSTGNHLHFEVRLNGAQVNPEKYLYK